MRVVPSKRCHHGKPTMRDHPATVTAKQPPEHRRSRRNGTNHTQIRSKRTRSKLRRTQGITIKVESPLLTWLPRHATWQCTRFHKRPDPTTTTYEKIRHTSYQNPSILLGEAVACRRPGALVNKLESAWLQGVWLGRDSKTDEYLIGTPNGMLRSRGLKRRVQRRRWDTTLLNAMILDPREPTPVTGGRPLKVRSDRQTHPDGTESKSTIQSDR